MGIPKKTLPTTNKAKIKSPTRKSVQKTDADKIHALEAQLAQREAELAVINSIQTALASKLDFQGIIDAVGDKLSQIFQDGNVGFAFLDKAREVITFPYIIENGKRIEYFELALAQSGLMQHILKRRRPVVINSKFGERFEGIGTFNYPGRDQRDLKSWVSVPIFNGDEIIGGASLRSWDRENAFLDSDVSLLQTIVNNMSVALENVRLFDESQRGAQEIATMAEIGREISATLDLSTVLERIALRAMDVLRARDVVLRLLESDGRLPAAVAIGKYADIYKHWDAQLGKGLSGSVAQSGIAEIINDPENDPRVIDIAGTEEDKARRAILFAPLLIGETVIGVLSVWRDKNAVGPFTQADLDFTVNLARQAAIAIQNARLFAESQQRFKETEILRAANVALTKSFDLDSILSTLLDYLQQIVPYDTGSVFLLESETHLTARATRGYEQWVENPDQAIGVSFRFKTLPHIQAVIEDQTTFIIQDVVEYPHWIVAATAQHVRNWLAVPLIASGKTIGMYSLDKAEAGFFTSEHQRLAENLATQAAIAIQNATLYKNQLAAREQAETLQAVTQALSRTLSLQEVFDLILTELEKVVPYDSCSVQQLEGDEFVIVGGRGFPNFGELIGLRFPSIAGDLNTNVITSRQPYIVDDVVVRFPHFKNREHGRGRIHGWLGVPLIFGDRLIGMLALDKHEKAFYTPEHAQLAMAFAAQAATAIENARLFETERTAREQAEVQTRQMTALNRVAQAVTSTLDLQSVLEIAAREMVNLLNARSAGVGLLNNKRSELRVVAYYSRSDEPSAVGLIIPVEGNLATQQVIETGQSVLIPDAQNTPLQNEATRAVLRARNTHCILIVPLMARGEVIGTIGPDTDEPDRVFTPAEVQLAQTIANQLAGVIENARLFEETQRLLKQTEQRATELQVINNVGQTITGELDLNALIEHVGDKLREAFNVGNIRIAVVDEKTGLLISPYVYRHGERVEIEENWQEKAERYKLAMRASARTGLKTWVINTNAEKSWRKFAIVIDYEDVPKSFVMLPLLAGKEVIGGITIPDYEKENAFTDFSIGMLETIASNMGTAIQNVRLFNETQRLFEEAKEARAAAERANKAKSTFLANMSHELRTPLNAIMGFTRIVKRKAEGALPEKQIENLDKVLVSSEHLLGLINTVLDIAKIEAGRTDVIPAKFSLNTLADQCATLAMPLLKPNVTLEKQVDDTLGFIFSDQDKIKQIVLNLLSNAAKFTHEGNILLSVQKVSEEKVAISVADSGIGISAEALGRVFEEFQQADNTTTRQYGGTGLGLTISRNLARLLGGDLTAASDGVPGKGSTFTLTIPIQYGRKSASPSDAKPDFVQSTESQADDSATQPNGNRDSMKTILIVEDTELNINLLTQLLEDDYNLLIAKDGEQGVNMAGQNNPDLILMDISLPIIDGYEATRRIRTTLTTTPIIGLSAHAMSGDAEKAKEAGCNEHMTKPIDEALLIKKLNQYLR